MSDVYWSPGLKLADVEKMVIKAALRYTNGDKVRAAGMLGVTPPTIRSKITIYEIDVEEICGRKQQPEPTVTRKLPELDPWGRPV